jgi:hypothetical protein
MLCGTSSSSNSYVSVSKNICEDSKKNSFGLWQLAAGSNSSDGMVPCTCRPGRWKVAARRIELWYVLVARNLGSGIANSCDEFLGQAVTVAPLHL